MDQSFSNDASRPATRNRLIVLAVAVLALGLVVLFGVRLARGDRTPSEVKLNPYHADEFSLTLFDGSHFSLSDQRGKIVVLNFWASWCKPCKDEAPVLERSWQQYRDQGVVFLGIDIKDTPNDARNFLQRFAASYPNGFDADKRIYIDYGVYGLPETFVVGPDGLVLHHVIGPVTQAQLDRWLAPLVASNQARP